MQHRDDLGERVDHHPEPERVRPPPQPCTQFIQLHVRQVEVPNEVVVQHRTVFARPCQPGGDGGVAVAKDAHGSGDTESFGQRG